MAYNFKNRTILVTGGAQGIGKGTCVKLVNCGATVIAVDRSKPHLDALVREYPKIEPVLVDLDSWTETRRALAHVGRVDGVVNNAAVAMFNPFLEVTEHEIDATFNVNVKAVINVTQIVAKGMVERGKGSIVNVSSICSMNAYENYTVYCGTKAAVCGITRVMALELGKHNVRANCVNPTVVLTEGCQPIWGKPAEVDPVNKQKITEMKERTPMGRFAEVEEIANAILFLLSDSSSMINGVSMLVDGGHRASPFCCSK